MIEILGRSRIRKKIILLFVYNQRKEFYLSEIARQVKTSAGTTQRELGHVPEFLNESNAPGKDSLPVSRFL